MIECIVIRPEKIVLNGHDLLRLRESSEFKRAFGAPSRHRDIKMHPNGIRTAMVWDQIGLVAYEDLPEGRMSHLHLAFDAAETPEHPLESVTVGIDINGTLLPPDATERMLPIDGDTPISTDFGRRYYCEMQLGIVDLIFECRRDARGRKFGARRLASLSFSWRDRGAEQASTKSQEEQGTPPNRA